MKWTLLCACLTLAMLPSGASAKAERASREAEVMQKEIGIQLYSVRSLIGSFRKSKGDYRPVLQQLAEMGYTSVETASYDDGKIYKVAPEQFAADLKAAGLEMLSAHCTRDLTDAELAAGDFAEALRWWDTCIDAHRRAGAKFIVIPSMRRCETLAALDTYCRYFDEVGARCRAAGLRLGYHNHSGEFRKIEGQVQLDYMLEHSDPAHLFFEMDVYWTVMGQASPVDYFQRYPGRFTLLHIKDRYEVGRSGMVGFDAIFGAAATAGVEHIIVEMEGSSYDDVLRSVKECCDYLQQAPFVKPSYAK